MDDTQQSRVSDAAATRKRRSSILKSQRPARTPFSELEFNVATPTDTAKSRRVSFSRRTGVAEFVTNEATTTWKNFYEEHNKSLESSGNDSDVNATRQPIEHLGKRIFDDQFEEVEGVDFMSGLNPSLGTSTSLNNINFTEQIASLDCTSDLKLTAPRNAFELSALTDHQSKLFGNDFTVTGVGELSGRIEVNFSTIQHIGEKDDLDDIERDLKRGPNAVSVGPSNRHDISEYIEVDLNMTHVAKSDDCDMSITDTVHSPKVQDVSKNCSIDKKLSVNKDWVTDKENIAINPYAAPREADNFAVNDEPNQVLVFDGKRLTIQTEKPEKEYRKTLVPNTSTETPQRKTIVLNTNDDLPNFVSDVSSKSEIESKHSIIYNDFDLSMMSHVRKVEIVSKRNTIHDNTGNISITQALPSKIISGVADKRRTTVYDEEGANISMTQALPSKIISGPPERRRTLVYNEGEGNISMTQTLSSNIISANADRQTVQDIDQEFNISMTQALPSKIISGATEKRRTMVYDQENGNISMTQALPTNIISDLVERRRTTLQDVDGDINISMTQALPSNIISGATERRRTVVYDQEEGNISVTQALPSNIISGAAEKRNTIHYDDEPEVNISITQVLPAQIINDAEEKHRTMVYDQEDAHISMTQILPSNIISGATGKRLTMVYTDDDAANVSMTQVLPTNIINGATVKCQTMVFNDEDANISITQTLPAKVISGATEKYESKIDDQEPHKNLSMAQTSSVQIIIENTKPIERRRTVLYDNDSGNISITQMIPASILQTDDEVLKEKRRTIVYDDNNGNISVIKSVSIDKTLGHISPKKEKPITFDKNEVNISINQKVLPVYVVLDTEHEEKRRSVTYGETSSNLSITQAAASNLNTSQKPEAAEKRRTIVFQDDTGNISVTQDLLANIVLGAVDSEEKAIDVSTANITLKDSDTHKRRTIVFEDDTGNISVTRTIPAQILPNGDSKSTVITTDVDELTVGSSSENTVEHKTITSDNNASDVSAPQPVYASIITPTKDMSKDNSKHDNSDISSPKNSLGIEFLLSGVESHSNVKLEDFIGPAKDQTMDIVDDEVQSESEMSMKESSPKVELVQESIQHNGMVPEKEMINTSVTRPIPTDLMSLQGAVINNLVNKPLFAQSQDVLVYPSVTSPIESKDNTIQDEIVTKVSDKDNASIVTSPSGNYNTDVVEHLTTRTCSEAPSLHSKESEGPSIESKSDVYHINTNAEDTPMDVDNQIDIKSISLDSTGKIDPNMSIMDGLLNMSEVKGEINKDVSVSATESSLQNQPKTSQPSNDSLFYIIREEDAHIQTDITNSDKQVVSEKESYVPPVEGAKLPAIEYKVLDTTLQNKLHELSSEKKVKISFEKKDEKSPYKQDDDKSELENNAKKKPELNKSPRKSFRNANDTKELLDMISDFTDKTRCDVEDDDAPPPPTKAATENKMEPMRLSFAPKRQSIVFSREDLLNNISMAQAALQKSRIELEDSTVDDTQETFTEEANSPAKTGRLSSEVVKTLHFDDESISACSTKSDAREGESPLRKTAFGETSYMKENKANVIPSYLQDVTSGIKALMSDLIKPMADVLPFNSTADRQLRKPVSTHDTQIQANLITSSQIDIESGSSLNLVSENVSSFYLGNGKGNQMLPNVPSVSDKLLSSDTYVVPSETSESWYFQPNCVPEPPSAGQVLIFDHNNPLNNILLGPLDCSNAHPYNPVIAPINDYPQRSDETLCGSEHSAACQANEEFAAKDCDMEPENVTTMYHFNVTMSPQKESVEECPEKISDSAGDNSNMVPIELPPSIAINNKQQQHTIEVKNAEFNKSNYSEIITSPLKNAEVNTIIAMKENKELLNASSSLTLVDDSMVEASEDCTSKTSCDEPQHKEQPSPKRAVYEIKEQDDITEVETDSDLIEKDRKYVKSKKRNYKPTSLITAVLPNVDITPKPKSKMQKLSNSPESKYSANVTQPAPKVTPERDVETQERILAYEKVDLKPRRNKEKTGTTLTVQSVQQVITEFHVETGMNQSILSKQVSEARKSGYSTTNPTSQSDDMEYNSLEDASSFTSSKHLHAIKRGESVSTDMSGLKSQSAVPSEHSSKSGWCHDMKSMSSSASDFDAGVNIVAKIDMLPFMGSHECEWESSTADTWCFRLLHGRIRLTVRLAHSHANAIKTRVRADTPVNDITVETIQHEKKNPVSFLCVRFACESMRYMVARALGAEDAELGSGQAPAPAPAPAQARAPALARAVPPLLRRCAATARVALRWGRAMHDAKLQLAYTLTHDGYLTLKVANIPLRSVWEVRLRLALVAEGGAPWPRAGDVRVARVVSDVRVRDADVRRALAGTPRDWGHAPRTVWRIFRYLKNKTRDDDLLLGA